jgi:hypothetical protein
MSGGSAPSTSTQYVKSETSSLPEYAKPFYMDLMGAARAETLGNLNETPMYGGQRIAPFTEQQDAVQKNILAQQTPGQFGAATGLTTAAGLGSLMSSQYDPGQFSAQQIGQPNLQQFQMQGPQTFGQDQAQQYMSPYMRSVMDVQKREAVRDAQQGQLVKDLGAARQGAYGGSRQLLAGIERERNLGQQLGDIESRGMQSAYENAQQQFERDRAAQMGVGQQNLRSALETQQLGTESGLRALLANQQYGLDAQRLGEQSRQFASQQQLAGYGQAGQMGRALAEIGQTQQQGDMARLNQQQQTAAQEQAIRQQLYDVKYQDFLREQNYPLEMLQQYSSLLRGVPVTPNTTSTTTMPQPSLASQIMGTGLGALGAYKALS